MKALNRYCALLSTFICLILCYHVARKLRRKTMKPLSRADLHSFITAEDIRQLEESTAPVLQHSNSRCRMETCFNFDRCEKSFKVYVYPKDEDLVSSDSYEKILQSIVESGVYTSDPEEACLFVLSIDTLDRDSLSQDYIRNMKQRVENLDEWNNGENHIIFNLYSGTWPDYTEELGFDIGKAILAKASMSVDNYRPQFDISLPLFHRSHPNRGGEPGFVKDITFPPVSQYFLAFKGKRYVYGIGSETRNSLFHLHNGKDIAVLTTCKHGKNWQDMQDDRCETDNSEYDRWDYGNLLANATFCLVPRGRRLGSFRFLETLQAGCVPVIMSNGWQLPFGEVIDWTAATISIDERQLLQVPEILRMVTPPQILEYRLQTQIVWDQYLSSVRKIVLTTLEIIRQRVYPHTASSIQEWNSRPGVLFSAGKKDDIREGVCGVVSSTTTESQLSSSANIFRIIRAMAQSGVVREVVILWRGQPAPPPLPDWYRFSYTKPERLAIKVVQSNNGTTIDKFQASLSCHGSNVLTVDDDVMIIAEEISFTYNVFKDFSDRIVGFSPRLHYWDGDTKEWKYTSKPSSQFSMISTNAAMFLKDYAALFHTYLQRKTLVYLNQTPHCQDILFNFLVSHFSKKSPIKVTQRKRMTAKRETEDLDLRLQNFNQKQECMTRFSEDFGEMPLILSQTRLDPVLFKDPVSNRRKKYKKMETLA